MSKDINNQSKVTTELYILKPGPSERSVERHKGGIRKDIVELRN